MLDVTGNSLFGSAVSLTAAEHNSLLLVIAGCLGVWIYRIAYRLSSTAAILTSLKTQKQCLNLRGMGSYTEDFKRLHRNHLTQILRLRRTIPSVIIPRVNIQAAIFRDTIKIVTKPPGISKGNSSSSGNSTESADPHTLGPLSLRFTAASIGPSVAHLTLSPSLDAVVKIVGRDAPSTTTTTVLCDYAGDVTPELSQRREASSDIATSLSTAAGSSQSNSGRPIDNSDDPIAVGVNRRDLRAEGVISGIGRSAFSGLLSLAYAMGQFVGGATSALQHGDWRALVTGTSGNAGGNTEDARGLGRVGSYRTAGVGGGDDNRLAVLTPLVQADPSYDLDISEGSSRANDLTAPLSATAVDTDPTVEVDGVSQRRSAAPNLEPASVTLASHALSSDILSKDVNSPPLETGKSVNTVSTSGPLIARIAVSKTTRDDNKRDILSDLLAANPAWRRLTAVCTGETPFGGRTIALDGKEDPTPQSYEIPIAVPNLENIASSSTDSPPSDHCDLLLSLFCTPLHSLPSWNAERYRNGYLDGVPIAATYAQLTLLRLKRKNQTSGSEEPEISLEVIKQLYLSSCVVPSVLSSSALYYSAFNQHTNSSNSDGYNIDSSNGVSGGAGMMAGRQLIAGGLPRGGAPGRRPIGSLSSRARRLLGRSLLTQREPSGRGSAQNRDYARVSRQAARRSIFSHESSAPVPPPPLKLKQMIKVQEDLEIFGMQGDDTDRDCLICMAHPKEVMLLPCRHTSCCSECLQSLRQERCPICRSSLSGYVIFPMKKLRCSTAISINAGASTSIPVSRSVSALRSAAATQEADSTDSHSEGVTTASTDFPVEGGRRSQP